jgi:hypothetical protein
MRRRLILVLGVGGVLLALGFVLVPVPRGNSTRIGGGAREASPLDMEVLNPETIPGLPVVVRVVVQNVSGRRCMVGDPGPMNDALRLYVAKPGGSASEMYSHWRLPGLDDEWHGNQVEVQVGWTRERYFFVDIPVGRAEIWVEYHRQAEQVERTARWTIVCRADATGSDDCVRAVLGLASSGDAASGASVVELARIAQSGERSSGRLLALAALIRVSGQSASKTLQRVREDKTEEEAVREGASELLRRIDGRPWGPERVR